MAGPSRLFTVYQVTMASAGTLSSEVDLGGSYTNTYLQIHTLTSNSQHMLWASPTAGGTYVKVYHPVVNSTTTAAPALYQIHSATTGALVPIPQGLRYMKVERSATADSGEVYKIFVGD